jgi:hypothetical protein
MTPEKETLINRFSLRISQLQRLEAPRILAPLGGVSVWGPEEAWASVRAPGVRLRGSADFHRDLPRLINASDINLSVSKCHTLGAVPPRVFEILA